MVEPMRCLALPTMPPIRPTTPNEYLDQYFDISHLLEREAESGLSAAMFLAHSTSLTRGWHHDKETGKPLAPDFPRFIALIHSELSEALEGDRRDEMSDKIPMTAVEEELADALIRLFDTAARVNADIITAFILKNRYNLGRPDHSDAARAAAGGKRY